MKFAVKSGKASVVFSFDTKCANDFRNYTMIRHCLTWHIINDERGEEISFSVYRLGDFLHIHVEGEGTQILRVQRFGYRMSKQARSREKRGTNNGMVDMPGGGVLNTDPTSEGFDGLRI